MSDTVIRVENLSKQYRLGTIGTGSLAHDLNRWWHALRGKEDPYLKIGEENDRTSKGTSDYVWSLQDINFDIKQGDAVGIIGRNGAGKSTLLKILSRVTTPTTGHIKIRGRVASLLEVGTGFHPDLTGKENIFLNGAILGMSKQEIKRKFDEMVNFSGVERYIDTPVKRYSSGMYVRLAFAVAAFLEPEILIIDEVLAVGDAEFQKKCLGKMKDVSGEGRTVLFVSHTMAAISTLCNKGIFLQNGKLKLQGNIKGVITEYINSGITSSGAMAWDYNDAPGDEVAKILKLQVLVKDQMSDQVPIDEEITVVCEYEVFRENVKINTSMHLLDNLGNCIFASSNMTSSSLNEDIWFGKSFPKGRYISECKIPANFLNEGKFLISWFVLSNVTTIHAYAKEAVTFNIYETGAMRQEFKGEWIGLLRPKLEWNTSKQVNTL